MQTAINPALAAAMTLEQAAQVGQFQPTTPDGAPTVAAQLMQRAAPSLPQVAQQAGLGGQIQAMQMQEAQKALMNAAMQQQQRPQGLEALNPPIGNFAQGGIVGYANGDMAEDPGFISPEFGGASSIDVEEAARERARLEEEERRRRLEEIVRERARNMEEVVSGPYTRGDVRFPAQAAQPQVAQPRPAPKQVPAMPAQAPRQAAPTTSAQLFDEARRQLGGIATLPVSPQQAIEPAIANQQAIDEYRRRMGLPAEMERIASQEADMRRIYGERERILSQRMKEVQEQQQRGSLAQYLMGFRQMKGRSVGEGLMSAGAAADRYEGGLKSQFQRLEDLKIQVQELSMDKQNELNKMRDDIANGRFADAMKRREAAQNADNALRMKQAEFAVEQAKVVGGQETARIREAPQASELERMLARLQVLRRTDPEAAKRMEEDIAVLRGAGRRPAPAELRQRMLEQYADNWENKMEPQEKIKLSAKGIKTFEDYVAYRDRIAGVAPTGGSAAGQVLRFDERGNLIK